LERDRVAVLIRQAAFEGVVDFTKARPSDPVWWAWLGTRLDQLENRNLLRLYEIQHRQNIAAMPVTTPEGVKEHWDRANDLLIKSFNRLFPWLKKDEESDKESFERSVGDLNRLWAEAFGDPNDPEVQDRIWETACSMAPNLRRPE
jgi:hypothetical protein